MAATGRDRHLARLRRAHPGAQLIAQLSRGVQARGDAQRRDEAEEVDEELAGLTLRRSVEPKAGQLGGGGRGELREPLGGERPEERAPSREKMRGDLHAASTGATSGSCHQAGIIPRSA